MIKEPSWALQAAARAWCTKKNSNKVMDVDMAVAFARILAKERKKILKTVKGFPNCEELNCATHIAKLLTSEKISEAKSRRG